MYHQKKVPAETRKTARLTMLDAAHCIDYRVATRCLFKSYGHRSGNCAVLLLLFFSRLTYAKFICDRHIHTHTDLDFLSGSHRGHLEINSNAAASNDGETLLTTLASDTEPSAFMHICTTTVPCSLASKASAG